MHDAALPIMVVVDRIASVPALRDEVIAALPALERAARSAAGEQGVARVVGRRLPTFPQTERSEAEEAAWWEDWFDACGDLSEASLEAAMKGWIAAGNEWMPKPGVLAKLAREAPNAAAMAYNRARAAVERGEPGRPVADGVEPWRDLPEDEYRALSLTDKIRHHLIAASELGRKAGPMFRQTDPATGAVLPNGMHLTAEQMPPEWHVLKARQRAHLAEAETLREKLTGKPRGDASTVQHMARDALEELAATASRNRLGASINAPPPIHGKADARGITPELRALRARQAAEGGRSLG